MNNFHKRQGQMVKNQCYFYTQTIHEFKYLLNDDEIKMIIINSLKYLVKQKLIEIYAFVIMPNHIHILWTILNDNGKECPSNSFSKFTAHTFSIYLQQKNPVLLQTFLTNKKDRTYQFWKRDPLAIPISTNKILLQKMEYIHLNPTVSKWNLVKYQEEYKWSSANFYLNNKDEFEILTFYK